uniref:Extracellular solute-binding protein family 3 n=1 Tax=Cyanothece sp. (strain PCC 7425 / ATCC 29141) TaxID=395961 RepID=B8HPT7_CYAP4
MKWMSVFLLLAWLSLPAQAAELKQILQRGRLIVAVKDNLPPLGFRDQGGQLQGLEIDIARQLAKELFGTETAVEFKPVANVDRLEAVLTGQADLAIANLTATAGRYRLVNFTPPYYFTGTGILTKGKSLQRLTDLNHRPVAVLQGSSAIAQLRFLLPNVKLVGVNSYQEAKTKLDRGEVGAVAADSTVLTGWRQTATNYYLFPTLLSADPLAIAFPKGVQFQDLQIRLQQILDRWQKEGWLTERIRYWGLPDGTRPSRP